MSITTKVALIHEYGGPEALTFEEIPVAEPGDNEVRVRNTVIGLNFVDVYYRRGQLKVPKFPTIIGHEAAGVVESVGSLVTGFKPGDRVIYGDRACGAYSTVHLHPAERLVLIPDRVTDEQAAASFLRGITARFLVKEAVPLQPGDTILYHAAAGGVGQIFVQWAKSLGVKVIGTVSSAAKAEIARAAGCDEVINYATEDFVARVLELTDGVGVNAVFDSVGKDTFKGSLAVLKKRGSLVQFGNASGVPEPFNTMELAPKGLMIKWAAISQYVATPEQLKTAADDLLNAIESGVLKVDPVRIYSFNDVVQAHRDLEERLLLGSAVMRV
jgi:NADPH2:quinone reductase